MSPRLNKKLKDISKSLTALNARKQKKVAIGTGHPGKNEGRDGDIVVRKISRKGMHLFVRYGQKWYSIPLEDKTEIFGKLQSLFFQGEGKASK